MLSPALREICKAANIDLGDESTSALTEAMPAMIAAVDADNQRTRVELSKSAVEIRKSALDIHEIQTFIPFPGIERTELIDGFGEMLNPIEKDPNACFDSCEIFGGVGGST